MKNRITHGELNLMTIKAKANLKQSIPKHMLTQDLIMAFTSGEASKILSQEGTTVSEPVQAQQ